MKMNSKYAATAAIFFTWGLLIAGAKSYLAPAIAANTVNQLIDTNQSFSTSTFLNSTFGMPFFIITLIAVTLIAIIFRNK